MIIALVVVAVLLFVAVVLLSNAFGSVSTENSIRAKIAAFDAAEAGIDRAVEVLDQQHGRSTACASAAADEITSGTLADGGSYHWCIAYNGIVNGPNPKVHDHANARNRIVVPDKVVYAWSEGSGQGDDRPVTVEALIGPSSGLALPNGAIAAAGDIYSRGDVGIYESTPGAQDASMHANGNIFESAAPRAVQGSTYAAGVDQITGASGRYPGSPAMPVPPSSQVDAAAGNASNAATGLSPNAVPPPTHTQAFFGDLFMDGDVDLQRGLVTFNDGGSVFIEGNLCIHDNARIVNHGSVIWVTGSVAINSASGGYSVPKGSSGMLIVLGVDGGRPCPNNSGFSAVQFDEPTQQDIGFIYAPNGSIDLSGQGVMTGAIDAGKDVYLDNTGGGGLKFDPKAVRAVPTYDYKVLTYMEY